MKAEYDTFDYPHYWKGREYEHKSEIMALRYFLKKIKKRKLSIDIGGGYGRLTPYYEKYSEKVIITDPSAKLLKIAKKNFKSKKFKFIKSSYKNLPKKIKHNSADLIVLVRVLHHIKDPSDIFDVACELLKDRGYIIMEFANKRHLKAAILEFIHGNFTFILDIFPKDIRSQKSKKRKTIPFFNYHPDKIREHLVSCGYVILEERSVSNIRVPFIKKLLPIKFILLLEVLLQKPFAKFCLGPSIFILAQKR